MLQAIHLGTAFDMTMTGSSVQTSALNTSVIRVCVSGGNVRIRIGANPTAAGTDTLLVDGASECFGIKPGHRIAAIGTAAIIVNVTPGGGG
jgi:CO/xanthine dehydrogenase Mo-binding subunit